MVSVGCREGGERAGPLGWGLEGYERARHGDLLGALDLGRYTYGHTTRVSRSERLRPVDAVRLCPSGCSSGAGIPLQNYPKTRSGSPSPQLGGVGWSCCHMLEMYARLSVRAVRDRCAGEKRYNQNGNIGTIFLHTVLSVLHLGAEYNSCIFDETATPSTMSITNV